MDIDASAVKSIRKAFEVNKKFERKKIEGNNKAALSGTLTSSQFYHSLYADRYSDSTYARKYRIRAGFNWLVAFSELLTVDDEIAIGWGGGFAYKKNDITAYGDYYYALNRGLPTYGSCKHRRNATLKDGIANAGVVFSLPQGKIIEGGINPPKERLKSGYISFFLYKKTAENQVANVTSKYLHKVIQISSLSISTEGIIAEANIGPGLTSDCNVIMINY